MTAKGGTSQACAACKYQRRKCAADCQLAPYFPADQPRQFQNAHRLFGVCKIAKILKRIDPSARSEAMRSIIYESNMRERYPVYGCLGVAYALWLEMQHTRLELEAVYTQLEFHRRQSHHHHNMSPPPASPTNLLPNLSQLQLQDAHLDPATGDEDNNYALSLFLGNEYPVGLDAAGMVMGGVKDEGDGSGVTMQFHDGAGNPHLARVTAALMASSSPAGIPPAMETQQYDEISPYLDNIDDRQSYVDCKVPCESSSEESMKDTVQSVENVSQNDLKSAAACFSLTSVVN